MKIFILASYLLFSCFTYAYSQKMSGKTYLFTNKELVYIANSIAKSRISIITKQKIMDVLKLSDFEILYISNNVKIFKINLATDPSMELIGSIKKKRCTLLLEKNKYFEYRKILKLVNTENNCKLYDLLMIYNEYLKNLCGYKKNVIMKM